MLSLRMLGLKITEFLGLKLTKQKNNVYTPLTMYIPHYSVVVSIFFSIIPIESHTIYPIFYLLKGDYC